MAEEDAKALNFVHETVLKKRKNNEDWAIKRRGQLAAKKQRNQESLKLAIKRPEQFVKEYRDKVITLDLVIFVSFFPCMYLLIDVRIEQKFTFASENCGFLVFRLFICNLILTIEQELDIVRMKHRLKKRKAKPEKFDSKLLFVIRIHG